MIYATTPTKASSVLLYAKFASNSVSHARSFYFPQSHGLARNKLVMRLKPNAANIKSPGVASSPMPVSVGVECRSLQQVNPNAYTRLVLDALRGRQASFVRADDIERSWDLPCVNSNKTMSTRTYTSMARRDPNKEKHLCRSVALWGAYDAVGILERLVKTTIVSSQNH